MTLNRMTLNPTLNAKPSTVTPEQKGEYEPEARRPKDLEPDFKP